MSILQSAQCWVWTIMEKHAQPAIGLLSHLSDDARHHLGDLGQTWDRLPVNITCRVTSFMKSTFNTSEFSILIKYSFLALKIGVIKLHRILSVLDNSSRHSEPFGCVRREYSPLLTGCFLRQYVMKSLHVRIRVFHCPQLSGFEGWKIRFFSGKGLLSLSALTLYTKTLKKKKKRQKGELHDDVFDEFFFG